MLTVSKSFLQRAPLFLKKLGMCTSLLFDALGNLINLSLDWENLAPSVKIAFDDALSFSFVASVPALIRYCHIYVLQLTKYIAIYGWISFRFSSPICIA